MHSQAGELVATGYAATLVATTLLEKRGWTLDVLKVVRSLNKVEFSLSDVYSHTDDLQRLQPKNKHVHEKIRQQLQH